MTDPRHDTDLDPFERRLATRLGQQADTIAPDPDGLLAIRARVGRRRRRRHLVVGLASVLALVVLVAGVLELTRGPDDADVVDAGGSTMPFLGFANETWQVMTYAPGTSYSAVDAMEGSSDQAVMLLVTRDGTAPGETNQTLPDGGVGVERIAERTIEHSEGPLQVGTIRWASGEEDRPPTEGPALWWSPAPGWTATLAGNSPASFDDVDALLEEADPVVDVDRTTWERHLPDPLGAGNLLGSPPLILPDEIGTTQVVSVTSGGLTLRLDPRTSEPSPVTMLASPAGTISIRGMWEPTPVRGVEGRAGLGENHDGLAEPRDERSPLVDRGVSLTWTEHGHDYSLLAPFGTSIETLIDLAATLEPPSEAVWAELVFPPASTPPPSPPVTAEGEEPSAEFRPR